MGQGTSDLKALLIERAKEEGFDKLRIARPDSIPKAPARLQEFVDKDRHGQMKWMGERMNWRGNPAALWPEARSVITLAESYAPEHDPLKILEEKDRGAISVYAQYKDYHDLVKKRLKRLGRWLIEQESDVQIKVFVDTAPVMEKPIAAAAGLGWQGKHTNLVARDLGNWFFIGSIFTTLELPIDEGEQDHCGSCRSCLDICPTNAFPEPYQLDARRCISYLTIEYSGSVDVELREKMGNRIYGCDDCLAVCPWNKFAQEAQEIGYHGRDDLRAPKLAELAKLQDKEFRAFFSKSPIKRIGRDRFVRNVTYAIGNSNDKSLLPAVQDLIDDPSEAVQEGARWAVERLRNG